MSREVSICSAPSTVHPPALKKRRRKRKRGRKKLRRGEKKEEEKERRQTETDGQKDKCGKTDGKRELKGEGEEIEG